MKIFQNDKVKANYGAYRVHHNFFWFVGGSRNSLSNVASVSDLYRSKYSKIKKVKANCGAYRVHHIFFNFCFGL